MADWYVAPASGWLETITDAISCQTHRPRNVDPIVQFRPSASHQSRRSEVGGKSKRKLGGTRQTRNTPYEVQRNKELGTYVSERIRVSRSASFLLQTQPMLKSFWPVSYNDPETGFKARQTYLKLGESCGADNDEEPTEHKISVQL